MLLVRAFQDTSSSTGAHGGVSKFARVYVCWRVALNDDVVGGRRYLDDDWFCGSAKRICPSLSGTGLDMQEAGGCGNINGVGAGYG